MGNLINLPNISPEAVESLSFDNEEPRKTGFKTTNYLNTRLSDGESSREIIIRLLPMDLKTGCPFVKASFHSVKVPQGVSESGYKSFLCLQRNPEIDHEKFGYNCPFCEMNKKSYEESLKETDELKVKSLQKLSIANHHKDAVIARCIERGKEDEGVKFWKFNLSSRKNDPYHQIMDLYSQDRKQASERGLESNIFDLYNGCDLILTLKKNVSNNRDVFTTTIVSLARYPSPLSKKEEEMKKWIFDEKKWTDVFTAKPYDYLKLISENRVPWFDKTMNKWVDKEEFENGKSVAEKKINNEIAAAEQEIKGYSEVPGVNQAFSGGQNGGEKRDFVDMMSIKDDELPF